MASCSPAHRRSEVSPRGWRRLVSWLLPVAIVVGVGVGSTAQASEPVRIVTEEFPPYNYTDQGRITGLSTDVVEAVLKELKLQGNTQSLPWARAYDTARNASGVLIYSIGRTPEREALFKWVGVIAPTDYYLYALPGKAFKIESLEMAKQYQVGTVNQDVGEQFLVAHGFVKGQNLQSSVKYELNYQKLKLGRIDLWIMSELTANHLARLAGDDPAKTLAKVYRINDLSREGYYMAFGSQTPDATVAQFKKGLDAIKKNGTFDALKKKWL
ncbi:MAG: transporter substrate-binding domain-containing protein [Rhodoferax sp.]|nr:transporter substrate-binding domain-containing protein [Rhodoferax sp.]